MPLTKVTGKGINDSVVDSTKLGTSSVTETKIADSAVTSAKISDGVVSADDLASSLNLSSKTITLPSASVTASMLSSTLDLSSKTVTLPLSATAALDQNIALLGFKMAITDGLTVFNLVDGVVDEFQDESGVDNSASTNLLYNSTDDYYINSTQPNGVSLCYSAGFSTTSITEPDTSVTGTNPALGSGTFGTFTVPSGLTSVNVYAWGAGGAAYGSVPNGAIGGGGGFASGTLAVSPSQVMEIVVGEQGNLDSALVPGASPSALPLGGGGTAAGNNHAANGGGGSFIITNDEGFPALQSTSPKSPQVFLGAGGGGGGGNCTSAAGGAGGGLTGQKGSTAGTEGTYSQTANGPGGGGGGQTSGGAGGAGGGQAGAFLLGGQGQNSHIRGGAGGGGFWGGGGAVHDPYNPPLGGGGGGSSYHGHPQITSGSTEGGFDCEGGGLASPFYVAGTNEGGDGRPSPRSISGGQDGYVLLSASLPATTTSSTIISDPFTSTTVPTTSRIVVFEENVGTPSLNTDIIASISRNGGTDFTTATLTDSGYVTGSSGQRILTGTATISGQPSGQSMKWKLQLANNTVKIHGVALQWK
jgi:hypothetical protein